MAATAEGNADAVEQVGVPNLRSKAHEGLD